MAALKSGSVARRPDLGNAAVESNELDAAYRAMAADEQREREASEWIEAAPDDALE